MQYPTCRHVKEDGIYCGSPAVRNRQYCYYHLMQRGRRLRRALALSRGEPCQPHIPPLDDLRSIRVALSEIVQGIAAGQLDHRSAGLMLYAIQQATTVSLRIAHMEEKAGSPAEVASDDPARLQEYPEFERNLGIPPGIDLDTETDAANREAEEHARVLAIAPGPVPARGAYTREEAYQGLQWQIHHLKQQLVEFADLRQQQQEKLRKEVLSAYPSAERQTGTV
ncbi:MAG TPA: hypothetical protein VMT56_01930 [Candidatus Bathyarchaeia archaeon]|nr:hypothetical protein [Candidatus Bathyarchaeia archaeon]